MGDLPKEYKLKSRPPKVKKLKPKTPPRTPSPMKQPMPKSSYESPSKMLEDIEADFDNFTL